MCKLVSMEVPSKIKTAIYCSLLVLLVLVLSSCTETKSSKNQVTTERNGKMTAYAAQAATTKVKTTEVGSWDLPKDHGVGSVAWSPGGDAIAFTIAGFDDDTDTGLERASIRLISVPKKGEVPSSKHLITLSRNQGVPAALFWLDEDRIGWATQERSSYRFVQMRLSSGKPEPLVDGSFSGVSGINESYGGSAPDDVWYDAASNTLLFSGALAPTGAYVRVLPLSTGKVRELAVPHPEGLTYPEGYISVVTLCGNVEDSQKPLLYLAAVVYSESKLIWCLWRSDSYVLRQDKVIATSKQSIFYPRISPDGRVLACLQGGNVNLYGMDSGKRIGEIKRSGMSPLLGCPFSWSPDGKKIMCIDKSSITIVEVKPEVLPDNEQPKTLLGECDQMRKSLPTTLMSITRAIVCSSITALIVVSLSSCTRTMSDAGKVGDKQRNAVLSSPAGAKHNDKQESSPEESVNRKTETIDLPSKVRGSVSSVVWSPDGKHIAFAANFAEDYGDDYGSIWIMTVPKSGQQAEFRKLTHLTCKQGIAVGLFWLDNDHIGWAGSVLDAPDRNFSFLQMGLQDSKPQLLIKQGFLGASGRQAAGMQGPDDVYYDASSRTLLFSAYDNQGGAYIRILPLSTKKVRTLSLPSGINGNAPVTLCGSLRDPERPEIYIASRLDGSRESSGGWQIWLMKSFSLSKDIAPVVTVKEMPVFPRLSPDGKKLAYMSYQSDILLYDLKSGKHTKVATISPMWEGMAPAHGCPFSWSPDGNRIACADNVDNSSIKIVEVTTEN